ncbi:cupin domain-containing protein [Singulisphaera sp. Ch08]|uniref:Cupin domain-containing protein n=1 Tax=Singulisphaera sp. Ch08 TaxID=3120278 RepID=A0AAU7CG95_9BACT
MSAHWASRIDEREVGSGKIVDLVGAGGKSPRPYPVFPRSLHEDGPSRVIPLESGRKLDGPDSATAGLALNPNFIRLRPGEPVATHANATAEFYYVLRGHGRSRTGDQATEWRRGDSFLLPSGQTAIHAASEDSALFWVHDEPLRSAMETGAPRPKFEPTIVRPEGRNVSPTDEASDPGPSPWSFLSVRSFDQTTGLRSMVDVLPGAYTRPAQLSRSTTLHLILDCQPGGATLIGKRLDGRGRIIEPVRVDWDPASAIVNSPGTWFAHINNSKFEAHLLPLEILDLRSALSGLAPDADLHAMLGQFHFESPLDRPGTRTVHRPQ